MFRRVDEVYMLNNRRGHSTCTTIRCLTPDLKRYVLGLMFAASVDVHCRLVSRTSSCIRTTGVRRIVARVILSI